MDQPENDKLSLVQAIERRLHRLSPDRLRVANDFLAYLEEREENEATQELLNLPGFEQQLHKAVQQAKEGQLVPFENIRRAI
jgi:hypothetical protein